MKGDFTITLPAWILDIGKTDTNIFFKDKQKESKMECLSWGIDDERVLRDRSALEVYYDLLENFRLTFSKFLDEKVITLIEIGLGAQGELRYPSHCKLRRWEYPGVGAFLCYDEYMQKSLKAMADKHQYSFCSEVPEIECSYNSNPSSCEFFSPERLDSLKSRFFLNWYAQKLIKHGNSVLSQARSIFGKEIPLNVKLTGIHWWYTDIGESHAAELMAGFFNSMLHEGYITVLKMLKSNNTGLKIAVDRSYKPDASQSSANPDKLMEEVTDMAIEMASHPDFDDDDKYPVPISTWNIVPCDNQESYESVMKKALDDWEKANYTTFTYYGLEPLMEAPDKFAEFISKMHSVPLVDEAAESVVVYVRRKRRRVDEAAESG